MDSATITAVTALLGLVGGGVGFLIRRADKRRETNEELLIRHLEDALASAEKEIRHLNRVVRAARKDGDKWRAQLHLSGITPAPPEWTEVEEDE